MLSSRLLLRHGPLSQLLPAGADYCLLPLQQTCCHLAEETCACALAGEAATAPASAWINAVHAQLHASRVLTTSARCNWASSDIAGTHGLQVSDAAGATHEAEQTDPEVEKARVITRNLRDTQTLQRLVEIVQRFSGSLNPIHVSAALITAVKLAEAAEGEQQAVKQLLQLLTSDWDPFLQQAGPREISNCLWACARLGCRDEQLWRNSLDAFSPYISDQANVRDLTTIATALAIVSQDDTDAAPCLDQRQVAGLLDSMTRVLVTSNLVSERILSSFFMLAAKLPSFHTASSLEALAVQGTAKHAAEALVALDILQQLPEADVLVPESTWQRILSPEQLQKLAAGTPSVVGSTLVALGRLCTAEHSTLDVAFAQECAEQLVCGPTASNITQWSASDINNGLYGCSIIGVKEWKFWRSAADAASNWLPAADAFQVESVARALVRINYRKLRLMTGLMQRGKQLLQDESVQAIFFLPLAVRLSGAVAALNIQELAEDVQELLRMSEIKHMEGPLPAYAAVTLGKVHTWLAKIHSKHSMRGLHDGLTGLLTEQQLAACAAATEHIDSSQPKQSVDISKSSVVTGA